MDKFDYRANLVEICSKLDLDELIMTVQYLTDDECKQKIEYIIQRLDELSIPYSVSIPHQNIEY